MNGSVVVVGGGGAGLAAAVVAAEAGCDVTLVHRDRQLGGSSALSVGSITASRTALQRAAGIVDGPREHLEDLLACSEELDETAAPAGLWRLELLAEEAGAAVDWLAELGAELSGPHPEPPHRVARMHNVVPDGHGLIALLEREAARHGVRIVTGRRAMELIVEDGRVAGVAVRGDEPGASIEELRATTTILASGDAGATFATEDAGGLGVRAINPFAQDDATRLTRAVGAAAHASRTTVQLRSVDPPYYRPSDGLLEAGAVVVGGPDGRRLHGGIGECAQALATLRPSRAFMVFDAAIADRVATADDDGLTARDGWLRHGKEFVATMGGIGYAYLEDMEERGLLVRADSLEQLADAVGMGPGATVEAMPAHDGGPFFALGPFAPSIVLSDGGLVTDREMAVLRPDGSVVEGLLGAGSCVWGPLVVRGHGQHLAWALVSGRRAGRVASGG